jgi:hypothetical protein
MSFDRRIRSGLQRDADAVQPDVEGHLAAVTRHTDRSPLRVGGLFAAAAVVIALVVFLRLQIDDAAVIGPGAVPSPIGLEGAWVTTLSTDQPDVESLGMAGTWTIQFLENGSLVVTAPRTFPAPSRTVPARYIYAVTGNSLLTNLFASDYTAACVGPGTYDWTVESGDLVLRVVEDTCVARRTLLATAPWASPTR